MLVGGGFRLPPAHMTSLAPGQGRASWFAWMAQSEFFNRQGKNMRKLLIAAGFAFALSPLAASAQTALSAYADAKGYIDVQKLTCAQLAGTFQEDADFLGVWYSGWYNGLAKKHAIKVDRVKEGIHEVIVYCKDHQDKKVIQAIDVILKARQD
jgi:hypothetical protein